MLVHTIFAEAGRLKLLPGGQQQARMLELSAYPRLQLAKFSRQYLNESSNSQNRVLTLKPQLGDFEPLWKHF